MHENKVPVYLGATILCLIQSLCPPPGSYSLDDLGVGDPDDRDGDDELDDHEADWVGKASGGSVVPLLPADAKHLQAGAGEVASLSPGRLDQGHEVHHAHHPDAHQDKGWNAGL